MRSKKVYFPLQNPECITRIVHDVLSYNILDLDLDTFTDFTIPFKKNICQSIPYDHFIRNGLFCTADNRNILLYKTSLFKQYYPNNMNTNSVVELNLCPLLSKYFTKCNLSFSVTCNIYIHTYESYIKTAIQRNLNNNESVFTHNRDYKEILLRSNNDVTTVLYNKGDMLDNYLFDDQKQLRCDYIALEVNWDSNPKLKQIWYTDITSLVTAESLLQYDNRRIQLPVLDKSYLTDPTLGLWDAYWPEGMQADSKWYVAVELDKECEGADPWQHVRDDCSVCIDFGTSGTVAAVRENDGNIRLLRIGGDWTAQANNSEYENPTALEFSNYTQLLAHWSNEPWRPLIEWKDVKCSHQAKNELSDKNKSFLAACGIRNIKTWARNRPGQQPLRLHDEQGTNFELIPQPVEQQLDGIGEFDKRSLDPIELYAFLLGLSLNNQSVFGGRIYCDYHLTFPVKFPQEVRQRILQGFYRGLLRSMPLSLVSSPRWQEQCPFKLTEEAKASEPTAFAAGVLPYLGIKPNEDGVAFGVFDFGGGTTDFAFGLYRTATVEENGNEGWEQVIEVLDVAGDEDLGGEHLLDLLAYEVIKAKSSNADVSKRLPLGVKVVCPLNMRPFDGSELLFANSKEAQANTVILREVLRSLWEEGKLSDDDTGQFSLSMKGQDGKDVNVQFIVDEDDLKDCLKQRIREGVRAFFTTFQQAFYLNNLYPDELHVLLAGNSCRSPLVQEVFQNFIITEVVPNAPKSVIVHYEIIDPSFKPDNSDANPKDKKRDVFIQLIKQAYETSSNIDEIIALADSIATDNNIDYHLIAEALLSMSEDEQTAIDFLSNLTEKKYSDDVVERILLDQKANFILDESLFPIKTDNTEQKTDSLIPTLKTGVALGLLRLLPGEATGVVERNRKQEQEEAPFLFSVGTFKNDLLIPVLQRNMAYGEWKFLGKVVRSGFTLLGYSSSPLAMEQKIARTQCLEIRINWGKENFGRSIYIKATSPYEITLALSQDGSEEQPEEQLPDETTAKTYTLKV